MTHSCQFGVTLLRYFSTASFFLFLSHLLFAVEKWGVVCVPVADLRASSGSVATSYDYDPLQETQLLYGELVKILSESGNWLFVSAVEQPEFSHNTRWEGYPGWVRRDAVLLTKKIPHPNFVVQKKRDFLCPSLTRKKIRWVKGANSNKTSDCIPLSLGTKLLGAEKVKNGMREILQVNGKSAWIADSAIRPLGMPLSQELSRKKIVESAAHLLGDLYFWGGRSAHIPDLAEQVTAVDCSGLVNLAYRVAGIDIPRDSLEQFMKAKKIKAQEMQMGDLIFSASKEKPEKISHVSIFIDTATLIEAPQTGLSVRKISYPEKFGVQFSELEDGKTVGDRIIYFGTYFER